MARNIGELVTVLKADTRHFNRGIRSAKSMLGGMGRMLKNIATIAAGIVLAKVFTAGFNALRRLVSGLIDAAAEMQLINLQIQTLASREMAALINSAIEGAVAWRTMTREGEKLTFNVAKLRDNLGEYADAAMRLHPELQAVIESEQRVASITSDANGMWVTASQVFNDAADHSRALSEELKRTALLSPFSIQTTNQLFKLALAFQFSSDQSMRMTKGMLNVAAGIGATSEQIDRMMFNFAQIRMQGKIMSRDFWELGKAGFDLYAVLKEIERQTGYTIRTHKDFNALIQSGKLTWEDFVAGFETSAERDFGAAAERMVYTVVGLKNTLSDLKFVIGPAFFDPMLQGIAVFAGDLFDKFLEMSESGKLEEIGTRIGESIGKGIMNLQIAIHQISLFISAFGEAGGGVDGLVAGLRELGRSEGAKEQRDKWFDLADSLEDIQSKVGDIKGLGDDLASFFGGEDDAFNISDRFDIDPTTAESINGLVTSLRDLSTWVSDHKAEIQGAFLTLVVVLKSFAGSVYDEISPSILELKDQLVGIVTDPNMEGLRLLLTTIAAVIGVVLVGAIALFTFAAKGLLAVFSVLLEQLNKVFIGFKRMAEHIGGAVDAIKAGDWDALKESLGGIGEGAKESFLGVAEFAPRAVISGISEGFEGGVNTVVGAWNKLQEATGKGGTVPLLDWNTLDKLDAARLPRFDKPAWGQGFTMQPYGIQQVGTPSMADLSDLKEDVHFTMRGIYENLEVPEAHDAGVEIGRQVPLGMKLGIEAEAGEVVQAAKDMASSIAQGIREELDIRSPSEVMFEMGEYTSTGYTQGLESGFDFDYNDYMASISSPTGGGGGGDSGQTAALKAQTNATKALVQKQSQDTVMLDSITSSNARLNRATIAELQNIANKIEMALNKLPKNIRDSLVQVSG